MSGQEEQEYAAHGRFYSRMQLKLSWTRRKDGPEAKKCAEVGPGNWKSARALPFEPRAAAGYFAERSKRGNSCLPAAANGLVLWDFDDAPFDALARRYGLVQLLPAGAWRVNTMQGTHAYASAPGGLPGLKVELTLRRVTVSADGYLLCPLSRHPDGLIYRFENVDIERAVERPPSISEELYEHVLKLGGEGRTRLAEIINSNELIATGHRHEALRHMAGRLRGQGWGKKAIRAALDELAERFCEPLESNRELEEIVDWILSKPAPSPLDPVDLELIEILGQLPSSPQQNSQRGYQLDPASPWERPVPLVKKPPAPSFPLHTLPDWLRSWALETAHEKGASVDLAGTLALGVVAGALARHVQVSPRPGWYEPLNLYLATALEPGQRKSPVFKAAFRAVRTLERKRMAEWEENNKLIALSGAIVDKRRKELVAEAAADEELDPEQLRERMVDMLGGLGETEASPRPRLLTEDVTAEALAQLLAEHGRIIAASDEGAAIFENLSGRYAHGSTSWDVFNKAHSAADLVVDRKSSGPVIVWDPAVTLVIATQPRMLSALWGKPGVEGRGVLARPLYALPKPAYTTGRTPQASPLVLNEFERRVRALFEDVPMLALDEEGRPQPVTLTLDSSAETEFERYEGELAQERHRLGTSDDADDEAAYLGWLSKLAGQTARLAACLHAAEFWTEGVTTSTTIGRETIAAAVELARYFDAHALGVFGLMGELVEQRRANTILGWLRSRSDEELETLTVRDVHRSRKTGTTAAQVKAALRVLEVHGFLRLERQRAGRQGGRPSELIHVSPLLHEVSDTSDGTDKTSSTGPDTRGSVSSAGPVEERSRVAGSARHTDPECHETRRWLAPDGIWRCLGCEPPAFPSEVMEGP